MTRKLIAFDIDGTLLNSDQEGLASSLEVISKLQRAGHFVTIATGRSLPTTKGVIKDFNFENYVLCNGAYAFVDHQQVHSNPLDKVELKKLVELANEKKIDLLYQTMDEVKQQGPFIHPYNREMQEKFNPEKPSYDFDIDKEEAIYQAILFCGRAEEGELATNFEKIRFTRWGDEAMDAVPINGSKAVTLDKIAKIHGFTSQDMIVFGDGENDIEMLKLAGLGIAMGNATDYVKGFANYVTKSNDEDGIWHAAKAHGLI